MYNDLGIYFLSASAMSIEILATSIISSKEIGEGAPDFIALINALEQFD